MLERERINISIPRYALSVMERLEAAGEEVYLVGGSLRDALLGITPSDYDMTCSAHPERVAEILSDLHTIATGLAHGTITVMSEGNPIEITTFRVDGSYLDSRRPESVSFTRSVEEDLARRDFTVNAIACSKAGKLIDLFDGRADLASKTLRAVGDPKKRFEEDALRIMRAFRFSAQLGFSIESNTLLATRECRKGLANISRERICAEFIRLICSPYPQKPLEQMKELGILPYVTSGFEPSERIFKLIARMPQNDVARLGFFFAEAEADVTRNALSSLKCSNKQRSGAVAISSEAFTPIKTQSDATRLRSRIGEHALFAAKASVILGVSDADAQKLIENDSAPAKISDLALGGNDLLALGFSGRDIGKVLSDLLVRVIEEPALNTRVALIDLAKEKLNEKGE